MSIARVRTAGLIWPTVAAIVGLAVLCSLGSWQLGRMGWKRDLIAMVGARAAGPVLSNADLGASDCGQPPRGGDTCEFRPVRLSGRFEHGQERHVFIHVGKPLPGISGTGYWIFTPFVLAEPARGSLYVNRGFVPQAFKDPASRGGAEADGVVTIEGVARRPELRAWFTAVNDPAKNIWFLRNPGEFQGGAAAAGMSLTVYVDQSGPALAGRLPVPGTGRIEIANRHFEYALTWFGLAATLLGVYVAFVAGRLRNSH